MKLKNLLFLTMTFTSPIVAEPGAEQEEAPGLLKSSQLVDRKIDQVAYYHCPGPTKCTVRCAAGEGHITISYSNVERLEIGTGTITGAIAGTITGTIAGTQAQIGKANGTAKQSVLIGVHYVDPVGKSHVATAFYPVAVSCVMDDLVVNAMVRVEDGNVVRPSDDRDVIFDVQPDN
jgi:hypothetical protein